jgi:CDP-diacylglycerol--glycerol-3-phosphate 3-phosphatidyltransferase
MRITANQVTLARLFAMPALASLIYGDQTQRLWAVIIGTLIGCTDFVDGWLARKHGPTILGGLMDPIADKVFIAVCFVPFADLGLVPWWLVMLMFLREYLVTALRSGFERRQRQLRSTYMSKMKTWVQMTSLGLIMLMLVVESRTALTAVFVSLAIAPLLGGIVFRIMKGRHWKGSWLGTAAHGMFAAIFIGWGAEWASWAVMAFAVLLTWLSAVDYVTAATTVIKEPTAFDLSRVLPALTLPVAGMLVIRSDAGPAWPVVAVLALEFAHGGIDNLLAHHDAAPAPWVWIGRQAVMILALAAIPLVPAHATWLALVAFAVSLAGTATTFVTRRRIYIEPKLRDKKRVAETPA